MLRTLALPCFLQLGLTPRHSGSMWSPSDFDWETCNLFRSNTNCTFKWSKSGKKSQEQLQWFLSLMDSQGNLRGLFWTAVKPNLKLYFVCLPAFYGASHADIHKTDSKAAVRGGEWREPSASQCREAQHGRWIVVSVCKPHNSEKQLLSEFPFCPHVFMFK